MSLDPFLSCDVADLERGGSYSFEARIQANHESLSDSELTLRASNDGDVDAFGELVRRHRPKVFKLLMRLTRADRILSEDLTQDTFLRAYRGMEGFEGRARFSTWIHRIAYFAYLNHRNRFPRHQSLPDGFENLATVPPEHQHSHSASDLRRDLALAVESLPHRYREIIVMYFLHQVPYRDIADELDLPLGTVKTQLYRAKAMLRDRMNEWSEGPSCAVV